MNKKSKQINVNNLDIKKRRLKSILKIFQREYPDPKCHLNYNNPYQLLIGCILSAQCTDKRVNEITKELFIKYQSPRDFANAKTFLFKFYSPYKLGCYYLMHRSVEQLSILY